MSNSYQSTVQVDDSYCEPAKKPDATFLLRINDDVNHCHFIFNLSRWKLLFAALISLNQLPSAKSQTAFFVCLFFLTNIQTISSDLCCIRSDILESATNPAS